MQTQKDKLGKASITVEQGYWNINKDYDKLTVVEKEGIFGTFLSRKPVPAGTPLTNRTYWIPFSSLKEEIVIAYQQWVNKYGGIIESETSILNGIQQVMNDVYKHLPQGIYVEGNIDCIEQGSEDDLILNFGTTNNKNGDFSVYINDILYGTYKNIKNKELTLNIHEDTVVRIECTQNGYTFIGSWNVACLYPSYIGYGLTYEDVLENDDLKIDTKIDITGFYSVIANVEDGFIFICVPKDKLVSNILMNGYNIPMEEPAIVRNSENIEYKIYKSINSYELKDYIIYIGDYVDDTKTKLDEVLTRLDQIDGLEGNGEDINTNNSNQLQFADRVYNALNPDGLGYVILRKDKTFAEQIADKPNTIFEIRYDFNLTSDVTMPNGCILKFNGGKIVGNVILIGNNTKILAPIQQIFDNTLTLSGSWIVDNAYPEWYNAKGDGVSDDTDSVRKSLLFDSIMFTKTYGVNETLTIGDNKTLHGNGKLLGLSVYPVMLDIYGNNVSISLNLHGNDKVNKGIEVNSNCTDIEIHDCELQHFKASPNTHTYAILIKNNSDNINIHNIYAHDITPVLNQVPFDVPGSAAAIIVNKVTNCVIHDCLFDKVYEYEDSDTIHIYAIINNITEYSDVIIRNCTFNNVTKRAIKVQANGVKIIGNTMQSAETERETYSAISIYGRDCLIQNNFVDFKRSFHVVDLSFGPDNNIIIDNVFNSNVDISYKGSSEAIVIAGNSDNTGLVNNFTFKNNVLKGFYLYAVRCYDIVFGEFTENILNGKSDYFFYFRFGERVSAKNNRIKSDGGNGRPFVFERMYQSIITDNFVEETSQFFFLVQSSPYSGKPNNSGIIMRNMYYSNSNYFYPTQQIRIDDANAVIRYDILQFKTFITSDQKPTINYDAGSLALKNIPTTYPGWIKEPNGWRKFGKLVGPYSYGSSSTRPKGIAATGGVLESDDIGYEYYDTTLNMPIYVSSIDANGVVTWVDANGKTPGKHSGELADMPNFISGTAGANDDGYMFTFTDDATYGNKIVWWNTNAGGWVDATGTVVIPIQ